MHNATKPSVEALQEDGYGNVPAVSMTQELAVLTLDELDAVAGGDDVICW